MTNVVIDSTRANALIIVCFVMFFCSVRNKSREELSSKSLSFGTCKMKVTLIVLTFAVREYFLFILVIHASSSNDW